MNSVYHYCTLFDSNYLNRGLALYESLVKTASSFHLYIFCFDQLTHDLLSAMHLPQTTLITMRAFEDEALLAVKPTRTMGEYCWTCTSSIIRYVLNQYDVDAVTYLDADLYFFSNPNILIDEMGDANILLTEHRYSPQYDNSALSGRFCVQFMTFKKQPESMAALEWWREACLQWCFNRVEDGKFGDQKYLDDWPTRFKSCHISQHLGAGIAPWNVQQYHFTQRDGTILTQFKDAPSVAAVFYHFHGLTFYRFLSADLGQYKLSQNTIKNIYHPYLKHLYNINQKLKNKLENPFVDSFAKRPSFLEQAKRKLKGNWNVLEFKSI